MKKLWIKIKLLFNNLIIWIYENLNTMSLMEQIGFIGVISFWFIVCVWCVFDII